MSPTVSLLDISSLSSLVSEFRRTMRGLLDGLCDDLEAHYGPAVQRLHLPISFFRMVARTLQPEAFSGWKVVGWIEALNDLTYFIDLREQICEEGERGPSREFVSILLSHCEEQFYEHSYVEEVFPAGSPKGTGLRTRVEALCRRLAQDITQESLFLVPGLPCEWLAGQGKHVWTLPCELGPHFERGEREGCISLGLDGAHLQPVGRIRSVLAKGTPSARFIVRHKEIALLLNGVPFCVPLNEQGVEGRWRYVPPRWVRLPGPDRVGGLTLGPTLVYAKDRTPWKLIQTDEAYVKRLQQGLAVLEEAWPVGASLLALLTSRIIPLRAPGVVSFSYRDRPGLSFINTFERDEVDLLDDMIHENSHHHLNLLLRKYRVYRHDRNREIFYSPWRRSLRPLRGILHATFTFTMGALLFERLSSYGGTSGKSLEVQRGPAGSKQFIERHVAKIRFRGIEEVASVRYSLRDLHDIARRGHWLTAPGLSLVQTLRRSITHVHRSLGSFQEEIMRSRYGPDLRRHLRELEAAGKSYRRILSKHGP